MRKIKFTTGNNYHLFNRGVDKRTIFREPADYERGMALLYLCNGTKPVELWKLQNITPDLYSTDRGEQLVDISFWVLMPNHYHIACKERLEKGISIFMHKFGIAFSTFFNKKYSRSGSLFEGTFKAIYVDSAEYLQYLFSYIHLNPVDLIEPDWKKKMSQQASREKILAYLKTYRYSSYIDYLKIKDRPESAIINPGSFPEYFSDPKFVEREVLGWLNQNYETKSHNLL